jgi:hypothetical protein
MSVSVFESACLKAVKSAFKKHYDFTGGSSLSSAPEAFIQGEIACALSKVARYVTLESGVKMLLQEAGAECRGRQPRNGRIDVVAWWENGKPRFLIEIKKVNGRDSITADVKRLRQVLGRGGATRDGLVIVYSDAKNKTTLESRFKHLSSRGRVRASAATDIFGYFPAYSEAPHYWQAKCYRIRA